MGWSARRDGTRVASSDEERSPWRRRDRKHGGKTSHAAPAAGSDKGPPASSAPRRTGFLTRHKRAAGSLLLGAVVIGFIYYVLPQIVGLSATLQRLRNGNPWWLALGIPMDILSIAAYIALFRGVFSPSDGRIGWSASYQITMAGGAASKLFAAAGGGGVALTVWALRASGLASATVAQEMVCFEIVNYAVYMLALAICGFGLWIGLLAGSAPFWLTLVPALFGLVVIALVLSMKWLASPAERLMLKREERSHKRVARWWHRAASVPRALQDGLASALELVRSPDRSWLAAIPAWGFEIGTLWASFRAFGHSPPAAVLDHGLLRRYVGQHAAIARRDRRRRGRNDRRVHWLRRRRQPGGTGRAGVPDDLLLDSTAA